MTSFSLLESLPVELIVRIFGYLDLKGLAAVAPLNHFLHDVYESSPELHYCFALQAAGMVDGDPGESLHGKLAELYRREEAWRTLDLSKRVTVRVPHRTSHIYDLSAGVYLLGDCYSHTITRDTISLRMFDLETCGTGPPKRKEVWRELTVDANIVDVALCLREFDLIAIFGVHQRQDTGRPVVVVYLRELSTGKPHPLAKVPDLVVGETSHDWGKMSIMMEIVGSRLLLLMTWRSPRRTDAQVEDHLMLLDWWEGRLITMEAGVPGTWHGFVFLSQDLVLLPNHARGDLEVLTLCPVDQTLPQVGFKRLIKFALPPRRFACAVSIMSCRAEPNPFGAPHPQRSRANAPHRSLGPIAADPAQALVLLQLYIRELSGDGHWAVLRHNISLVVHRSTLLELVEKRAHEESGDVSGSSDSGTGGSSDGDSECLETNDSGVRTRLVPWSEWGTRARICADNTHVSNWITTTAGQRYVGMTDEGHIVVKDFNPHSVTRARLAANRCDAGTSLESDATWQTVRIVEGFSAEEDVELHRLFEFEFDQPPLPCVEYVSARAYGYHGLLMDEERVLGLRHDEDTGAIVEVDVFTL